MAKMVYVVTNGVYSDYNIKGVFSTKKKAEAFKNAMQFDNVEEYELDFLSDLIKQGLKPIRIFMDSHGNVQYFYIDDDANPEDYKPVIQKIQGGYRICVTVNAKDEFHAAKIVNEMRVQIIAKGEFNE